MSLISRLFEARRVVDAPYQAFVASSLSSTSGAAVTETAALGIPTVWACVKLLADNVAMLPIHVSRVMPNGHLRPARDHALFTLLRELPNPEMTAFEMQSAMQGHLALWGHAFAEIQRDQMGRVVALWPLRPDQMIVGRDGNNQRVWKYTLPDGKRVQWTWANPGRTPSPILHLRAFGPDGWSGYSPLSVLRNEFGLAISTSEYGARLFANGAKPGGVLTTDGKLSPDAAKAIKERWEEAHRGLSQAHRVAVLEQGIKWQQVGINPEDAQFLESRKFSVQQIASIFRVPPHMVGDVERSTSWGTGIELQQLGFLKTSLQPWLRLWTEALKRDLLTVQGWATHDIVFDLDEYLRADIKTRYEAFRIARENGVINADEWRARENLPPIPDGTGAQYWRPANYAVVGEEPKPAPQPDMAAPHGEPDADEAGPQMEGQDDGNGTPDADTAD